MDKPGIDASTALLAFARDTLAARIINSYGPTEATCSTTWVEIDAGLRAVAPNPFPIGRAKPYAQVFLENGEICVAGDHVMRGYLNRADLNLTRMFLHKGERAYRTGDLGTLDVFAADAAGRSLQPFPAGFGRRAGVARAV